MTAADLIERYQTLDYTIPSRVLVWQLSGTGFDHFQLAEIDRPRPSADGIAFRADVNSICFSDVKIIQRGHEHPRLANYDIERDKVVPGHELSFTVIEVGVNVPDRFQVGQRYILQADIQEFNRAVGYDIWGGMVQYGVFEPPALDYLIPVHGQPSYSAAALVEPWACVHASYRRAELGPRDRTVWACGGGGPMGQMHLVRVISMKKSGQCPAIELLVLTDISESRLATCVERYGEMAREAGIRFEALNPTAEDYESRMDALASEGFDYVIALAPVVPVVQAAWKRMRKYSVLNLFAGFKRGEGPLNMGDIHYDQITVTGNSGSSMQDMDEVLRSVEAEHLDTDSSVWAVVGMKAAKAGVQAVAEARADNKIVVYPQFPDLPLTPITELVGQIPFPREIEERVAAGYWSKAAEDALLNHYLPAVIG